MNITLSNLLDAINGPQQIILYDLDKDDIVFDGFISECPSSLRCRGVKSIDPVDSDGPRAGVIYINI